MENLIYLPGIEKEKIDTPAFLIDLDIMDNNISKMAEYCKALGINFRPHTKHHKSPIIAHKQIDSGAIGICCQKLGEAEVMVSSGVRDVLITYEIIGDIKIKRLMALCKLSNIIVTVDSKNNVKDLSEAAKSHDVKLGILLDVNVGQNRCGIEPDDFVVELAKFIQSSDNLEFKGIHAYAGNIQSETDDEKRFQLDKESMLKTKIAVEKLRSAKIELDIVTAGGTGTYKYTSQYDFITEIQPGSYVFMDGQYSKVLDDFDNSGTILTTIISKPNPNRIVLDSGMKAISSDQWPPIIKDFNGIEFGSISDEHLTLDITNSDAKQLNVGDKIEIIPGHNDTTVNLHTEFFGIRKGILESVWPISARAKIR